jgi:hypothetical protein
MHRASLATVSAVQALTGSFGQSEEIYRPTPASELISLAAIGVPRWRGSLLAGAEALMAASGSEPSAMIAPAARMAPKKIFSADTTFPRSLG